MKKLIFPIAVATLLLASCGNGEKPNPADSMSDATANNDTSLKDKQSKATFIMETTTDSMEIPHTTVAVDYNDSRTVLDPMICAGTLFSEEEMKDMECPPNTIAAVGGWYAGGGDYYYIVPTATGIAVYKGWQDEGSDTPGYHWEKFKEIN